MRSLLIRVAFTAVAATASAGASAETFYGYCTDSDHSNVISSFFSFEGDSDDYDEIKEQWEAAVSANLGVETYKIRGSCYAATDRAKAETPYNNILGYTEEYLIPFAPTLGRASAASSSSSDRTKNDAKAKGETEAKQATSTTGSAVQSVADEAAKRRADREAEFQRKQADYERKLLAQKQQVEDYKRAQEEVERKKEEQRLAAEKALDAHRKESEAYAEIVRKHQEDVAKYQAQVAGVAPATAGSQGGRFQTTTMPAPTREAAMKALMSQPVAAYGLTDIQCHEVTFYNPSRWSCEAYYYQDRKPAAGSAQ